VIRIATLPIVIAALIHCGCGDPVRDAAYAGQPIALLEGVIDQGSGSASPVPFKTRIALFWMTETGWIQSAHPAQVVVDGSGWRIPIYGPPPLGARAAGYALGRVLPFRDGDEDGRRGPDEPFHARSQEATIYWSETGLDPSTAPVTHPLPPGFHRIGGAVPCDGPWPVGDMDCGDEFGAICERSCEGDAICGAPDITGGIDRHCLFEADACAPRGGRLVPFETPLRPVSLWVPGCDSDADCEAGLICSAASGICINANLISRIGVTPGRGDPTVCSFVDR